ncbi:Hypothetical protein D9617_4g004610 [Elsinoe fawcettii]|nr:Hypothetical protein D9617_4g004610 [Elsinoe fawcettii]
MSLSEPIIYDPDRHSHLLTQITKIHIQAVLQDHVVATFLPPFDLDETGIDPKVFEYWQSNVAQIRNGHRFIVFILAGEEVAGYVTVSFPPVPTVAHRAGVEKLFVNTAHRRKGIAVTLMQAVEKEARAKGKKMLVSLDHVLCLAFTYPS